MAIQAVKRAFDILSCFTLARTRLGIGEISDLMGLPKGTVHGLVKTMLQEGFLRQDPETRKYSLGYRLYELGTILTSTSDIARNSADLARALASEVRLDARIAIWEGGTALLICGSSGRAQAIFEWVGPRIPAYCSAGGRAILAHLAPEEVADYFDRTQLVPYTPSTITDRDKLLDELEKARIRGYAIDREELIRGLAAVAAPIFKQDGLLAASISLSGSPDRILRKEREELVEKMQNTAMSISKNMGFFPEHYRILSNQGSDGTY